MTSTPAAPPVAAVVLGTRGSALARAQTERVVELLLAAWPGIECEARPIVTQGDRTQSSGEPLPAIGGKGLFTSELEQALRNGEIDLAVHSLKDLPTEEPEGIALGAVCSREDIRDCLVAREGLTLTELPARAVVGTSSLRRAAQLRALRPDLEIRSIRGNVDTRVRKVRDGEFDAAVLAAAGIRRLGLEDAVTEWLSTETMLPAPGQGALAVQCRAGDEPVLALLGAIDDAGTRATTTAERTFLRELGAGCTAPVAAHAESLGLGADDASNSLSRSPGSVRHRGLVATLDGRDAVRVSGEGEPEELGQRLAREALTAGAARILAARTVDLVAQSHKVLPLSGQRIVVTRPLEQATALAEGLERHGAAVTIVPLVAIQPMEDTSALDAALEAADAYDWIVFTSANGVAAVGERLEALRDVRVAAVGPMTAEAVRALGVEPAFVPERFAAAEIAAELELVEGSRILLPQADIAESELAERLRARGATVDAIAAYRTVEVDPSVSGASAIRCADAVVLASGSAARSLARLETLPDRTLVACIGPKTAQAAGEAGLDVGLVAEEATADGIIQALVAHYENPQT